MLSDSLKSVFLELLGQLAGWRGEKHRPRRLPNCPAVQINCYGVDFCCCKEVLWPERSHWHVVGSRSLHVDHHNWSLCWKDSLAGCLTMWKGMPWASVV